MVEIGRLGRLRMAPGCYIYVGSAHGPGGVLARVGRHLRAQRRRHWHIDFLLATGAPIQEVWYSHDIRRREHQWVEVLASLPLASLPLPGFGSSDCGCESHLVFFAVPPRRRDFARALLARFPGHASLQSVPGS